MRGERTRERDPKQMSRMSQTEEGPEWGVSRTMGAAVHLQDLDVTEQHRKLGDVSVLTKEVFGFRRAARVRRTSI